MAVSSPRPPRHRHLLRRNHPCLPWSSLATNDAMAATNAFMEAGAYMYMSISKLEQHGAGR